MATWQEHSLAVAPQFSGFGTANTTGADQRVLLGEKPNVQFATEIQELELMTGQVGAAPERLIGRRHGSISFKIPLQGMKSGYDPTSEDPGGTGVIPPWLAMVANTLGSGMSASVDSALKFWNGLHLSHSQYTSGGVASATSTVITVDDATASDKVDVGQIIATAASATTTTVQVGFAKTKSTTAITLFEASSQTVTSATANVYGSANAWVSAVHANQMPLTFAWVGDQTEACYYLKDAVCTGWVLTWEAGEVSAIEMSYDFYGFDVDKTAGGLQTPTVFLRVPQIVGSNNGRATLAGATQCGMESCSIAYTVETSARKCHSASQGIDSVSYRKPRIKVTCSIPWASADLVYDAAGASGNTGSHVWQSYLERAVTVSLGVYVGNVIGKGFAFLVPAGIITAVPQITDLDGVVGYQLEIEAGTYTGDSTDTAETSATSPLDSIFRLGLY